MVVAGIVSMGLAVTVLGLTTDLPVALVAAGVIGIANLVYVVPTQTIFGEVTPEGFLGRVVAIRSSIVVGRDDHRDGGVLHRRGAVQVGTIIAATGSLTLAAGLVAAVAAGGPGRVTRAQRYAPGPVGPDTSGLVAVLVAVCALLVVGIARGC